MSFDVPAQALGDVAVTAISTSAFYVTNFTILTVFCGVAVSIRYWVWVQYIILVMLGLIYIGLFEQNITGVVWLGLDLSPSALLVAGYAMLSINYRVAAHTLPADHRWAWLKRPYHGAALLVWGFWAVGRAQAVETQFLLFSVAGCTVALAHFAPVSTFTTLRGGYDTLIRNIIWALLVCVLIGATFVIAGAINGQNITVTINRFIILTITLGFAALFARNIFVLQSDRERAVQDALDRAQDKIEITEALLAARDDHEAALNLAHAQRLRLASASHDIRQPLSSLRTSFAALSHTMPGETQEHLQDSLDYLDALAGSYLVEDHAASDPAPGAATEMIRAEQIGETLRRMFEEDAAARDMMLTADIVPASLQTQPLALMRVLCNILSNAVKHGEPGRLDLEGQETAQGYTFTIRNPGAGDLAFDAWEKGDGSDGHGLGLSIVQEQAAAAGLTISNDGSDDQSTCLSVTVARV